MPYPVRRLFLLVASLLLASAAACVPDDGGDSDLVVYEPTPDAGSADRTDTTDNPPDTSPTPDAGSAIRDTDVSEPDNRNDTGRQRPDPRDAGGDDDTGDRDTAQGTSDTGEPSPSAPNDTDTGSQPPRRDTSVCRSGRTACGGDCVDLTSDPEHCGACNSPCGGGQSCANAQCTCPAGETFCAGTCVDTASDPAHCGACGQACAGGESCQQGSCKADTKVNTVIAETNKIRATQTDCGSEGVFSSASPLKGDPDLHEAAMAHARDMAMKNFFSHTGSDGSTFVTRVGRTAFSGQPIGENIAAGNSSASATVQQWRQSDGHCRNLMIQSANRIGVGVIHDPASLYGWYWVQVFGRK